MQNFTNFYWRNTKLCIPKSHVRSAIYWLLICEHQATDLKAWKISEFFTTKEVQLLSSWFWFRKWGQLSKYCYFSEKRHFHSYIYKRTFCKNIFTNKSNFKIYETIIITLLKALQIVTSRMSSVLNCIVTVSVTLRDYCLLTEV